MKKCRTNKKNIFSKGKKHVTKSRKKIVMHTGLLSLGFELNDLARSSRFSDHINKNT